MMEKNLKTFLHDGMGNGYVKDLEVVVILVEGG